VDIGFLARGPTRPAALDSHLMERMLPLLVVLQSLTRLRRLRRLRIPTPYSGLDLKFIRRVLVDIGCSALIPTRRGTQVLL
jgi:hypothetical protein